MTRGAAHELVERLLEPLPNFPQAACLQRPDLGGDSEQDSGPTVRAAVAVCCRCPHVAACAAFAVATPHLRGIWGGLTLGQRQAMRAAREQAVG